jgi:5-carboxymethyl-2-hydroxymuconate isomerase
MRLATFKHNGRTHLGEVREDRVYLTSMSESLDYMIQRGMLPAIRSESLPLSEIKLDVPLHPGKIIAIGRNYSEHAKETGSAVPKAPLIFAKLPSALIGHGDAITWRASITQEVDWEGELAVVIGRRAWRVRESDALKHVFGYSIANDVTARDLQNRIDAQWTRAKGLDTFCPLGPWIVTADSIPNPQTLGIRTMVNGLVMQDGHTRDMIFPVARLVSYCSEMFTLNPGDVILTGTPAGVGAGMTPPTFLKDGDTVEIEIDGIGRLSNPCRVEAE